MTDLSNWQCAAADDIGGLVTAADKALALSVEKSLEAGRRLLQAKDDCPHGTWLPFLARAGVPERKAQRLMTLARSGLESDTVSDLGGVTGALEMLKKQDKADALLRSVALDFGLWHDLLCEGTAMLDAGVPPSEIRVLDRLRPKRTMVADAEKIMEAMLIMQDIADMYVTKEELPLGPPAAA